MYVFHNIVDERNPFLHNIIVKNSSPRASYYKSRNKNSQPYEKNPQITYNYSHENDIVYKYFLYKLQIGIGIIYLYVILMTYHSKN